MLVTLENVYMYNNNKQRTQTQCEGQKGTNNIIFNDTVALHGFQFD